MRLKTTMSRVVATADRMTCPGHPPVIGHNREPSAWKPLSLEAGTHVTEDEKPYLFHSIVTLRIWTRVLDIALEHKVNWGRVLHYLPDLGNFWSPTCASTSWHKWLGGWFRSYVFISMSLTAIPQHKLRVWSQVDETTEGFQTSFLSLPWNCPWDSSSDLSWGGCCCLPSYLLDFVLIG